MLILNIFNEVEKVRKSVFFIYDFSTVKFLILTVEYIGKSIKTESSNCEFDMNKSSIKNVPITFKFWLNIKLLEIN